MFQHMFSATGGSQIDSPPGYVIEKELDKGGFGTVYKAINRRTRSLCALKAIDISGVRPMYRDSVKAEWRKEVETLMKVSLCSDSIKY